MTLATTCLRWSARVAGAALLAALPLLPMAPAAQEPPTAEPAPDEEVVERVALAFEEGDCEALLDLAASRVEIVLLGQSARYSRGQAVLVLRDFFRRYPPGDVELSERSTVGDGRAAMGRYWSANSTGPFALYVGFRVGDGDAWRLEAIRIERGSFQRTGLH
jgi:hypothetical protein